jgi:hypothetical protein
MTATGLVCAGIKTFRIMRPAMAHATKMFGAGAAGAAGAGTSNALKQIGMVMAKNMESQTPLLIQ